ncbi:uncharacterized protein LOC125234953 [Leguminivora glycinivorella]|uniref:uncharacterized protein LOC125225559 n=1 Tax=Leguminivora glycinivorella TaxID=1035111 RepID=UPI0020108100|nr:uncharacterized protein LOC125225559 [Leguminivora glycinivorella]XP_047997332.1 uncharacterized protein LOC125234953 [Leguminivora glycinivorella]
MKEDEAPEEPPKVIATSDIKSWLRKIELSLQDINQTASEDFTLVTRCFKCQLYNHAAKTCKMDCNICGHCGEAGHTIKECPKKDAPPKCATCSHFRKPSDHQTGDPDCPARQMAEKRFINSIDYEGA